MFARLTKKVAVLPAPRPRAAPPAGPAPAEADILVFCDRSDDRRVGHDLANRYGRARVGIFDDLNPCLREAFDRPAALIVLDVMTMTLALELQVTRLKSDPVGADIPLLVRAEELSDWHLSRLAQLGATVVMSSLQTIKVIARVNALLRDGSFPANALPERVMRKALDCQIERFRGAIPDAPLLDRLRGYYGVDIDTRSIAAAGIGGDLWGVAPIDATRFAFFVADFCGHGPIVAPNTIRLSNLMRSGDYQKDDPAAALAWVNDRMRALLPRGQFLAMAYGVVDVATGTLSLAGAAFSAPLMRTADSAGWRALDCTGLPLGFQMSAQYETCTCPFPPGSGLLLYSDALVETPPPPANRLDPAKVARLLDSLDAGVTPARINEILLRSLDLVHSPADDDLTLMVLRRRDPISGDVPG